jgi:hypothetical protein
MCALFLAPIAVRACETTEAPEQTCCCCPCCQETESSPSESHTQKDECSCRMAEKHDEETSPAVLVSVNHSKLQTFDLTPSIDGSFDYHQSRPTDSGSSDFIFPGRDQPLYILHSSFLI